MIDPILRDIGKTTEQNEMQAAGDTVLVAGARAFATAAHAAIDQRRKYSGAPYIEHPAAVAALVAEVSHTPEMLAAAWLHDVVEDTKISINIVQATFGAAVAELVGWLTDVSRPEDGKREIRKALDREHISKAPAAAQTIKLADLIDNTPSIVAHDPKFAAIYLAEAEALLEVLTKGDPDLLKKAREQITRERRTEVLWEIEPNG